MKAATLSVERLTLPLAGHERNPRIHPKPGSEEWTLLERSLADSYFDPMVWNRRNAKLVSGHLRQKVLLAAGYAQADCVVVDWDEDTHLARMLAANRTIGTDDDDAVRAVIEAITDHDKIALACMSRVDLAELTRVDDVEEDEEQDTSDKRLAELTAKWGTATGQVWELGDHWVVCGDSTKEETFEALGEHGALMVTDPPYGVSYDAAWRTKAGLQDTGAHGKVANDDRADWFETYKLAGCDVAYVWHPPGARQVEFYNSLVASGFDVRMQIIWAKSQLVIGRGHYHMQHEPCWYAVRKGATAKWVGDRKQTTLWQIDKPRKSETGHSTQKPIECMARPIINHTIQGELVLDPFLGSGTTLIACEQLGRKCRGIELMPEYIAVTLERWHKATGKMPRLL